MATVSATNDQNSVVPLRFWVARVLTYQSRAETFSSLATLFQGLCGRLREAGTLSGVYRELAVIKQRILSQGHPLDLDDVEEIVVAHNRVRGVGDPLVLGEPRVVLSVPGSGERMAYHREFVHNLKLPQRPLLTLNEETLIEVLQVLVHPKHFSSSDRRSLVEMGFPGQEGLGVLKILDTLYKATFSRTIRKELCDPKILFPLVEGSFNLLLDHQRTAHLTMPCFDLLKQLLFRLYKTADLAAVLDTDDRAKNRIGDGLRLLSGALHDLGLLPQKSQEVATFLKERRPSEPAEELEELGDE